MWNMKGLRGVGKPFVGRGVGYRIEGKPPKQVGAKPSKKPLR